jgi:hypothetical protein
MVKDLSLLVTVALVMGLELFPPVWHGFKPRVLWKVDIVR